MKSSEFLGTLGDIISDSLDMNVEKWLLYQTFDLEKLDFLPVKCRFCLKDFCEDHMIPERHECANIPQSSTPQSEGRAKSVKCPVRDCATPKGAMIKCDKCDDEFCVPHRLPESHR